MKKKNGNSNKPLARKTVIAVLCTSIISGCATDPKTGRPTLDLKETFASDDPCSNKARNWGLLVGGVAGGLIGNKLGGGKTSSTIIAAGVGAAIGGLIGVDMDRKRCELSKIAKQYDLDIQIAEIKQDGVVVSNTPNEKVSKEESAGMTVTVREKTGGGHFEVDSDQLTPKAKAYFTEIAKTYNAQEMAKQISDDKARQEYLQSAQKNKILLVGHTDDMGKSEHNAQLSERRARAVARLLKENGVPEERLYFQGAGETLPIADNRSDEGRSQNRRVEIVEVSGEVNFQRYLEARQPRHEYYRPIEAASVQISKPPSAKIPSAETVKISKQQELNKNKIPSSSANKTAGVIKNIPISSATPDSLQGKVFDFGGQALNEKNAILDIGELMAEKSMFEIVSRANADDTVVFASCNRDRPRISGAVISLKDGKSKNYSTSEYLPELYSTSWHDTLNGNLLVLNKVAVLRDAAAPIPPPEFKIYANYDPQKNRNAKPDLMMIPTVNVYRGSKGVLYRVFAQGTDSLRCVDILFSSSSGFSEKKGKIVYSRMSKNFVTDFKPKMLQTH